MKIAEAAEGERMPTEGWLVVRRAVENVCARLSQREYLIARNTLVDRARRHRRARVMVCRQRARHASAPRLPPVYGMHANITTPSRRRARVTKRQVAAGSSEVVRPPRHTPSVVAAACRPPAYAAARRPVFVGET